MTCAATMVTASHTTGFTLPGMMLEPGWIAGSVTSASPQRGPLFMSRTSFAIFMRLAATELRAPLAQQAPSCAPCASKWFEASWKDVPASLPSSAAMRRPNSGCVLSPVPTAVPPIASTRRSGTGAVAAATAPGARAPTERGLRVEPGPHRGAADRQLPQVGQRGLDAGDAVLHLRELAIGRASWRERV